jgi:hypothetical protein
VKSFKVTWTMHVSALTPREAASEAWGAMVRHTINFARNDGVPPSLLTVEAHDGHTTDIIPESQEGPETK